MKIISWNINGWNSIKNKGALNKLITREQPDIICLQETRTSKQEEIKGYQAIWNNSTKPGYSGTAILTRIKPLKVIKGLKNNKEGRVISIKLKNYWLINTYSPNAGRELKRLEYKKEFNKELMKHLLKLKKENTILTGDLNVAHQPIDIARPKQNEGHAGYTQEEREWLTKLLSKGFTDTYRALHPSKQAFTWWSYRSNARARNIGWRLDYFIINNELMKQVNKSEILNQVTGSDHCPIKLEINN